MIRTTQDARRKPQLIVALDVDSLEEAGSLVDKLYPAVKIFKVGSQLFTAVGPEAVKVIGDKGARVFLDLKFHDIPNTVYSATASSIAIGFVAISGGMAQNITPPVFMMTVHISGGLEMLKAAIRGAAEKAKELNIKRPFIVGVTRLTSEKNEENTSEDVLKAAMLAKDAGLDGAVCSVYEAAKVREKFGNDFLIVTPGIRPKDYPRDDQSRVATMQQAIKAGADFVVVGRPVIKAKDPLKSLKELLA